MWMWAAHPPLCQSGVFQSASLYFNRASWEPGHVQLPWLNQFNLPSTVFFFFFKFQNKHRKDSRNSSVSCGADLKGVFEIHTPKKQRKAWRNATSPSVQQTAQNLMAPYEHPPTSYSLLIFLLLLASLPGQVFRWLFFLGLATCTSISSASVSIYLLENCLFAPSSQGTAPPGPNTWGPRSERSCYLYQLISFSVAPSVCLPPWSLLALGRCFPWSHGVTQHPLLARGWVLTQSFPLTVHTATESSGKTHSINHSGFIMT